MDPWFGRHTSPVDWCEKNYEVMPQVAEFWNTFSNIPFIFAGIVLYVSAKRDRLPLQAQWVFLSLIFIGLSSAYFHATLSFVGQALDELGILLAFLIVFSFKVQPLILILSAVFITVTIFVAPMLSAPFLLVFGSTSIYHLAVGQAQCKDARAKKHFRWCLLLWFLAVGSWITERLACDHVQALQLHAVWHILVLLASINAISIAFYFLGEEQKRNPSLLPIAGGHVMLTAWDKS